MFVPIGSGDTRGPVAQDVFLDSIRPDLSRAPIALWIRLGEAAAICEALGRLPLKPAMAREIHKIYLAKGVLATTTIEGNTLSLDEVRQLLDHNLRLPPSKAYLAREVGNVLSACNGLLGRDLGQPITPEMIGEYNRGVLAGLDLHDDVVPGMVRRHSVTVGRYRAPPAEHCEDLLARFCRWIEESRTPPEGVPPLPWAILRAILAHLYFVWIHPFGDGNGRTARLLEFHILMGAGVPTAAAHLLSNHYNETRTEYHRRLDHASRAGEVADFALYAAQGLADQLSSQMGMVHGHQLSIAWESFVYETFASLRPTLTDGDQRRRSLVLQLSAQPKPVPRDQLAGISPEVARRYARRTPKTLTRDLNALTEMEMIRKVHGGYVANFQRILAFLPHARGEGEG